jgi:hypothetical protein
VTDGSFEDATVFDVDAVTSGGWTLSGTNAFFLNNAESGPQTPYGSVFTYFVGVGNVNSVSQPVALPSCKSGAFTLSYAYNLPEGEGIDGPFCTFYVTYGEQTIDTIDAVTLFGTPNNEWTSRTQTFVPSAASGDITFTFDCSNDQLADDIEFLLDNISVS